MSMRKIKKSKSKRPKHMNRGEWMQVRDAHAKRIQRRITKVANSELLDLVTNGVQ